LKPFPWGGPQICWIDMRIYLGGHLNFYHPQKEKWLEIDIDHPTPLVDVLKIANIPLGEVHLVLVKDEKVDLQEKIVSNPDEIKLYSAVGGG
jgi:sulfur carrier protein ThiS